MSPTEALTISCELKQRHHTFHGFEVKFCLAQGIAVWILLPVGAVLLIAGLFPRSPDPKSLQLRLSLALC